MEKVTIYKTIIEVEVLHSDERNFGEISFADILDGIDEGGDSGKFRLISSNKPLTGKKAVKAILNQGTDTEFFGMDENGLEIEE